MRGGLPKKSRRLSSGEGSARRKEIAGAILGLRNQYPIKMLLEVSGLKKGSFYYICKSIGRDDPDEETRGRIRDIYNEHKGLYGIVRITLELCNQGHRTNHKRVQRLMAEKGLHGKQKRGGRYSSYCAEADEDIPNLLNRRFRVSEPDTVWATDITEFKTGEGKVYLSPVKDLCTGEIISYSVSSSPNTDLVAKMLDDAIQSHPWVDGTMMHSDHGVQYHSRRFKAMLSVKGFVQSMSRKGCCIDNGKMESFFGTLKNEMYYGHEDEFETREQLYKAIGDYIDYYNNRRIQKGLGGMVPSQYRRHLLELRQKEAV